MNRRAALLGTSTGVWFEKRGPGVQQLLDDPRRKDMKVGDTLNLKDAPPAR